MICKSRGQPLLTGHKEMEICSPPALRSWLLSWTWRSLEEETTPQKRAAPGWHLDFRFFSLWTEDPVSQCLHTWPRETERMHLVCLKPPGCGICYTEWGNKYSWWKSHSWQVAEEIIQLMKSDGKASGLSHLNHCFYVRGTSNNKFKGTAPEPSHTDRVGLLGDTTVIREL